MKKYSFLLLFVCSGCVTGHILTTPNGYGITNTRNLNFHLKDKFILKDTSILSTNNIYRVSCEEGRWLKFYKDGRVTNGLSIDYPNGVNDTLALAGYYVLQGNDITIEMSDGEKGNDWSILVIKGKIVGDTLKFYKDQCRGSGRNNGHYTNIRKLTGEKCYYVKSFATYFFKQPDW